MLLEGAEGATPRPYLRDGFLNRDAAFSPDGRWLAYSSNESGTTQVFVRSFPDPGSAKYQVSADGGEFPKWRGDGAELYFVDPRRRVMAVGVTHGSGLAFQKPTALFDASAAMIDRGAVAGGSLFDVFPDGQRFLFVAPRGGASTVSLTVAVNWMADLGK